MPTVFECGAMRLVTGRDGLFLVNPRDHFIGQAFLRYGEFSHIEGVFFEQLCGPGDIVLEIGANIGAHTVALAKRVGPGGRVVAVEPQRVIFQNLCANIALNGLFNVDCLQVGATDPACTLFIPPVDYREPGNFGGISLSEA